MLLCRAGLLIVSASFLGGCLKPDVLIEYVPVVPVVSAELRTPVEMPEREVSGLASVGLILTDAVQALDTANGRIVAIDCILTAAEAGADPSCAGAQ